MDLFILSLSNKNLKHCKHGAHNIIPIDQFHIVLIIDDLNGLGHLSEFADQIEPKTSLALGRNCQQMQMCGDESLKEISEKSLSDKLTCEWICGKYSFYKSLLALYNSRRIIILLTSMQFFHRGYVAEFCTLAQCSRSSNKNGDDFDVFYDSCHI